MSVLDKIVSNRKKNLPSRDSISASSLQASDRDFRHALTGKSELSLIAELKRKSPSKGAVQPDAKVEEVVEIYKDFAQAISVLTEPDYFGGSLDDLERVSQMIDFPVLRKDFIVDPVQVLEARKHGAHAYLLMQACLEKGQMAELLAAGRDWNMTALVEVHTEKELDQAMAHEVRVLGVNNRDLNTLEIDIKNTERIVSQLNDELQNSLTIISESGLYTREDLDSLPECIDGVLIGTSLMSSENPRDLLESMFS